MQACLKALKGSRASSESDTCSDLTFYWLPPNQVFIQWLGNQCEAFYESPIMAYKAKEGTNLHIGLWQCTFSNGF